MLLLKQLRSILQRAYNRVGKPEHLKSAVARFGLPFAKRGQNSLLGALRGRFGGGNAVEWSDDAWAESDSDRPVAVLFGFNKWKRDSITKFLSSYRVAFAKHSVTNRQMRFAFRDCRPTVFFLWGMQINETVMTYAHENSIPIWRIEDGFLRSVGLGARHVPPLSLAIDKKGMYFDSTRPSDLEQLIADFESVGNEQTLRRANKCIRMILLNGLTKYNYGHGTSLKKLPPPQKKRVLVVGQVEDDASIIYGSRIRFTNNDIVKIARSENPEAEVIYKPHPDVAAGLRSRLSDPKDVAGISTIISGDYDLQTLIEDVDRVYTITSLVGFEALIRGKQVTVFGTPFYSGWGLTDDRQDAPRRNVKKTVEEVFSAAYILYPRYCVGDLNGSAEIEHAILALALEKNGVPRRVAEKIGSNFRADEIDQELLSEILRALTVNSHLLSEDVLRQASECDYRRFLKIATQ